MVSVVVFFFQAEDGIRDAQESRGLGDVYKRQVSENILDRGEMDGVNRMLNAAALTYVAAAVQAIMTLLYYAYILFGRRRD